MGFKSIRDLVNSVDVAGQRHRGLFRKTSPSVTTVGIWFDASMFPNHPVTNFYASSPAIAATLLAREGIQHGQNVSPLQKYLKSITAMCSIALVNLVLLDYLLYYPFIDGDSTDEQFLDNTVTLPRYATGSGVKAFVVAQGTYVGGAQFFINYTNQNGVANRISTYCTSNTVTTSGAIISSGVAAGQFGWNIPLQQGDSGVRSVQSFTFVSANGGIFALVLARDLGHIATLEANVPSQVEFFLENGMNAPEIIDGAFLNFITLANASLAAQPIYGSIETVWG